MHATPCAYGIPVFFFFILQIKLFEFLVKDASGTIDHVQNTIYVFSIYIWSKNPNH